MLSVSVALSSGELIRIFLLGLSRRKILSPPPFLACRNIPVSGMLQERKKELHVLFVGLLLSGANALVWS